MHGNIGGKRCIHFSVYFTYETSSFNAYLSEEIFCANRLSKNRCGQLKTDTFALFNKPNTTDQLYMKSAELSLDLDIVM